MQPTQENIDDLIAKYLSGEALPEEAMLLDEWIHSSSDNVRYFNESKKALGYVSDVPVDVPKMYQKVLSQLDVPTQKESKVISLTTYFTPLRIAASLLVISMVGLLAAYYLKNNTSQSESIIASTNTTQQKQLADGSNVFLNKNTKLTVEGGFNKKERKLKLEGEAFFEVVHNDDKPFIIDAGGVQIKDVGTSFNIKANPQSDSVLVFVSEGIVDMSNEKTSLRLSENQSAIYIRSTNTLTQVTTVTKNVAAYKTKVFHFKEATLSEVITALNEVYGNIITLQNEQLSGCLITVEFNNESPETIVVIITETLGLSYEKTNSGGYQLKGPACIQQ